MHSKTGYAIGKQDKTNIEEKSALEKGPDPLPSHEPQPQVKMTQTSLISEICRKLYKDLQKVRHYQEPPRIMRNLLK